MKRHSTEQKAWNMTNHATSETPTYDVLQASYDENIEEIIHRPKWDFQQACARVQQSVEKALEKKSRRDDKGRFLKSPN